MKRGRLPLTALRSFEVAGRLQSFTLAAAELYISQAAVSRQVRELETILGLALFERRHRRVSLTSAGETLLANLTAAFDDIGDCLAGLQRRDAISVVSVSAEPSFASCWLVFHLADFQKDHPHIDIQLDAEPRLIEFRSNQAALAIRHSVQSTSWPRTESRHLTDVRLTPAFAPGLLTPGTAVTSPEDLLRFPLLHEENRDPWRHWFETAGVAADVERGPVYADGGLILQVVLSGQGVALVDEAFSEEYVAAGRLVRPFDISLSWGAYWLVARRFDSLPDAASAFVGWLTASLAASTDDALGAGGLISA